MIREVVDADEGSLEERMKANKQVPMDRKFHLIRECYIDSFMQEAVKGVEIVMKYHADMRCPSMEILDFRISIMKK